MVLSDDIIYLSLLLVSIAIGPLIRNIKEVKHRQLASTVFGFFIVVAVSGYHVLHPLLLIVINSLILFYTSKQTCHVISFIFCFSYLVFFRLTYYFGLPSPPAHTNIMQMILTLKMVGLAFEMHNIYKIKKQENYKKSLKYIYQDINPSFSDIIHYAFCFAGVLIGPYYKFRTYCDMLHAPYQSYIPHTHFLKKRIQFVPIYVILFLLSSYIFPLEYITSPEILEDPFWYRIFYMTPSFFNFRMRIYAGFVLGECVCITIGLGGYPSASYPQSGAGPTNYDKLNQILSQPDVLSQTEYNFETVSNIYEYGSEFYPTMRESIRVWNKTVQYWLAVLVYKNLPFSKPARLTITMLVSSFWHGIHAGYYLCMLSAPFFLIAEKIVEDSLRKGLTSFQQRIFDLVWYVIKMNSFSYMNMAFVLLHIDSTFHYWKSIYFICHIFILVIFIISFFYKKIRFRCKKSVKKLQ